MTAVADAVRGQGERIGQATDLNEVLEALNARGDTIGGNWRSLRIADTYDAAAQDIGDLNAASTTSATCVIDCDAAGCLAAQRHPDYPTLTTCWQQPRQSRRRGRHPGISTAPEYTLPTGAK